MSSIQTYVVSVERHQVFISKDTPLFSVLFFAGKRLMDQIRQVIMIA